MPRTAPCPGCGRNKAFVPPADTQATTSVVCDNHACKKSTHRQTGLPTRTEFSVSPDMKTAILRPVTPAASPQLGGSSATPRPAASAR